MVSPSTPVPTLGSPNVFSPALNTKHRVCQAPPSGWWTLASLAQRSLPVWASKGDLGTGNIGFCSRPQKDHLTLILPSWECSRSSPWQEHLFLWDLIPAPTAGTPATSSTSRLGSPYTLENAGAQKAIWYISQVLAYLCGGRSFNLQPFRPHLWFSVCP